MRQVKVKTASGTVHFNYTISTPKNDNAKSIDSNLPTILFLHPVYIAQVIFHLQFASPLIRRFNLVGMDMRAHGETVATVPAGFRRYHAAEDVYEFMKALKLPPCHLVGLSLGACVALQTAVSHPDKVLSLFMLSPLPLIEPENVAAGRQEIFDCWADSFQGPEHQDALLDALFGSLQLGFNGESRSIISAMIQYTLPAALKRSSREELEAFHTLTVKFFVDRRPHPREVLAQIKCPVNLIHCGGDIAYPMNYVEELRDALKGAGIDVRISQIADAPHFGCVTHPDQVNKLLHEWIMEKTEKKKIPPAKPSATSPFEAGLVKAGYVPDDGDSEDDFF
ncbi:Alpha/Beta hydrolase protein [Crepidotus variabilis]|uniref:Alpha/Beta hydrolase protein n=1 Tax=Crepidotus variabilis TaxID=179855 RepID=A0A9P6JQB8_9AGAR|nr:Alpha/Beta hydrolase protein [Crepidotus variabilis]